jgi:ribosomal protein S3AE
MKDNDCVGGYHEIHEIKGLKNPMHIIATVTSIISNNIQYKDDDTVLKAVYISFIDDNESMEEEVMDYFKNIYPYKNVEIHKL